MCICAGKDRYKFEQRHRSSIVLCLTSIQIGVRLAGPQEHGLSRLQDDVVQEVNGEATNVSRIL